MWKTIIRIVRTQKNQQVINIPGDVVRHLKLKGGDAVIWQIMESEHVVLSRIDPAKHGFDIGKKV